MVLTSADNGKTIEAPLGESITIQLEENPTTGYRWIVDSITPGILSSDAGRFVPAVDAGVGGGGRRELTLTGPQAGVGTVRLKLAQPWEGDRGVSDRFEVQVAVRG